VPIALRRTSSEWSSVTNVEKVSTMMIKISAFTPAAELLAEFMDGWMAKHYD
jgi:hypothetical protein